MEYKGTKLKVGDYIWIKTTLSHHKDEVIMLRIISIDNPDMMPNNKDHTGCGEFESTTGYGNVGFYVSQIQRLATKQESERMSKPKPCNHYKRYLNNKTRLILSALRQVPEGMSEYR